MDGFSVILFQVRGAELAVAADRIAHVLPLPVLFRPPGCPRAMAGYVNLHGTPVPVLDAGILLGLDTEGGEHDPFYAHILLARDGVPFALRADRVTDFAAAAGRRPVAESDSFNGCVEAEIELRDRLVPLLSLDRLVDAQARQAMADFANVAATRLADWAVSA